MLLVMWSGVQYKSTLLSPGITNHDEYSLVRESVEDEIENKPNYGTLTLKRKKEEKERDVKMEQLRKKLKTDDEGRPTSLIISFIAHSLTACKHCFLLCPFWTNRSNRLGCRPRLF